MFVFLRKSHLFIASVKFVCKRSVEMEKFSVNKQLKFECGNVKFSHS